MSASLDHREPLALGGAHTYDNSQCAHLVCNERKGARLAAKGSEATLAGAIPA